MASAGNQRKDSLTSRQGVFGGTSYKRYSDPSVLGAGNEYGLYPWSAFRALLATYNGSAVAFGAADANDVINLLLFTSDIPALGFSVDVTLGTVGSGSLTASASVGGAAGLAFFRTTAAGATSVSVEAGEVGRGYVATGTSAPNDYIYCTGFPATITLPALPATSAAGVELIVLANSSTIASPVSFLRPVTAAATTGSRPIILLYSNYTQAIHDAGNVITISGVDYQVVGLYSVTTNT
jgi:hypothetical protein